MTNNSPAMQRHLNEPDSETEYKHKYLPYNIICPQAVTISNEGEFNAYLEHCKIRFSFMWEDIPLCCKRCSVCAEVAPDIHRRYTVKLCECGAERGYKKRYCEPCRRKRELTLKATYNYKSARIPNCKCGKPREFNKKYCPDCKAIKDLERVEKSRLAKIAKLKRQLKECEVV